MRVDPSERDLRCRRSPPRAFRPSRARVHVRRRETTTGRGRGVRRGRTGLRSESLVFPPFGRRGRRRATGGPPTPVVGVSGGKTLASSGDEARVPVVRVVFRRERNVRTFRTAGELDDRGPRSGTPVPGRRALRLLAHASDRGINCMSLYGTLGVHSATFSEACTPVGRSAATRRRRVAVSSESIRRTVR